MGLYAYPIDSLSYVVVSSKYIYLSHISPQCTCLKLIEEASYFPVQLQFETQ
jgi:hypothetical protein